MPEEETTTATESNNENVTVNNKGPRKKLKERIKDFFANPKKRLVFLIVLGLIIISLFYLGIRFLTKDNITPTENTNTTEETNDLIYQAPLDGIMTTKESSARHPLAVVVENHPDARPQAGLDKASIIYEAIAEGGITRFMAIFGTFEAEKVGPIRSARTYFVDWARGYDAYLAHVGGNIDALDQIQKEKVLDLDQFSNPSPYWRERTKNLASEHTMFTSTVKLRKTASDKKFSTANNYTVYKFNEDIDDSQKTALPQSQKITINFSTNQYKAVFDYDRTKNSYKRSLADKAHVDQITKTQINPTNIIVMTVKRKATITRINEAGYEMTTIGSGAAKIIYNGTMIEATWKKNSKTDREIFYDSAGSEIKFNRGQFWIAVVPPESTVTIE
ncbi:MAG: DUF3048 domain-containing protein [Patescibacteria group bacterium]